MLSLPARVWLAGVVLGLSAAAYIFIETRAHRVSDYIVDVTVLEGGRKEPPIYDFETIALPRWQKKNLLVVTLEEVGIDPEYPANDYAELDRLMTSVGIASERCNVIIPEEPATALNLPRCITDRSADIVIAYPKSVRRVESFYAAIQRIPTLDNRTQATLERDFEEAIKTADDAYCILSTTMDQRGLLSAFLLSDDRDWEPHSVCILAFSYAALGVKPIPKGEGLLDYSKDFFNRRDFGRNPFTALKFLYSKDGPPLTSWGEFKRAAEEWVELHSNSLSN